MVVLNKIYTKTGDAGETSLGNGDRVPKHALRVHVYGSVDELNSFLGLARLGASKRILEYISRIQNDLFDLGGDLCFPLEDGENNKKYPPLRINDSQVKRLESEIDDMNSKLKPLKSFVLPGGSNISTYLHLCRTICRRAERLCVELSTIEEVNPNSTKYLNRLSDWLFVASRITNNNGVGDILWVPGANR